MVSGCYLVMESSMSVVPAWLTVEVLTEACRRAYYAAPPSRAVTLLELREQLLPWGDLPVGVIQMALDRYTPYAYEREQVLDICGSDRIYPAGVRVGLRVECRAPDHPRYGEVGEVISVDARFCLCMVRFNSVPGTPLHVGERWALSSFCDAFRLEVPHTSLKAPSECAVEIVPPQIRRGQLRIFTRGFGTISQGHVLVVREYRRSIVNVEHLPVGRRDPFVPELLNQLTVEITPPQILEVLNMHLDSSWQPKAEWARNMQETGAVAAAVHAGQYIFSLPDMQGLKLKDAAKEVLRAAFRSVVEAAPKYYELGGGLDCIAIDELVPLAHECGFKWVSNLSHVRAILLRITRLELGRFGTFQDHAESLLAQWKPTGNAAQPPTSSQVVESSIEKGVEPLTGYAAAHAEMLGVDAGQYRAARTRIKMRRASRHAVTPVESEIDLKMSDHAPRGRGVGRDLPYDVEEP